MKIIGYILINPQTKEPWTQRRGRSRRIKVYEKEGVANRYATEFGVEYSPVYVQELPWPAASS